MPATLQQLEGKYEILQKLKEGGMGAIYKVRHLLLDEIRVVKLQKPHLTEDPGLRARFSREARMAIRVRHPNIAQLYDFSMAADGTAFMILEFIDGVTLQEVLSTGPPPSLPMTVEIALQSLQALSCLHRSGIVHRDISSDNLMLAKNFDGAPLIKLIDLGIAKDPLSGATSATTMNMFMGKARYSAPEQFDRGGAATLGPGSDLYSFGVVLYELLTGRFPYPGDSFAELASAHLFRPPLPFEESDPDGRVPQVLRRATSLALEKDPQKRVASADEMIEAIATQRAPLDPTEIDRLLTRARSAAADVGVEGDHGSSQQRLHRQFGPVHTPPVPATPLPSPASDADSRIETAAVEFGRILFPEYADPGSRQLLAVVESSLRAPAATEQRGPETQPEAIVDSARRALEADLEELTQSLRELEARTDRRDVDPSRLGARIESASRRLDEAWAAVVRHNFGDDPAFADRVEALQAMLGSARLRLEGHAIERRLAEARELFEGRRITRAIRILEEAARRWGRRDDLGELPHHIAEALDVCRQTRGAKRRRVLVAALGVPALVVMFVSIWLLVIRGPTEPVDVRPSSELQSLFNMAEDRELVLRQKQQALEERRGAPNDSAPLKDEIKIELERIGRRLRLKQRLEQLDQEINQRPASELSPEIREEHERLSELEDLHRRLEALIKRRREVEWDGMTGAAAETQIETQWRRIGPALQTSSGDPEHGFLLERANDELARAARLLDSDRLRNLVLP